MYKVYLRDTTNGHQAIIEDEWTADDMIIYQWTQGNYSCDCNRHLFMYGHEDDPPCGDTRFVLERITKDDVIIWTGKRLVEPLEPDTDKEANTDY